MLHNKMKYFIWLLWCCVLNVVSGEIVSTPVTVQSFFYDGAMYFKGSNVNSSYIKSRAADHDISKMYVYVADTFFADEDLTLNGIEELQIFANKWIVERSVTFDLSGLNGTNHEPTIFKGSAGKPGNYGMDGGNFLGLTNELINGENLTIMSNGGNGGDGQDGTANDDIYALFNGDNGDGESGWFNKVDLHRYYEKYFNDKGYDVDISDVDEHTSMYAVFVHNEKVSLNIRLHPRKCCGVTGKGGAGGVPGRSGTLLFKYVGESFVNSTRVTTPTLIENDGTVGKSGKDAKTCETLALDVRADTELKKVVFFLPPLYQSFTRNFTVLNHTQSSQCSPEYVKSEQPTVLASRPTEIKIDVSVRRYKRFLLENMKNESLTSIILQTYEAIDGNRGINDEYSLEMLMLEAYEVEINFVELKKSIDVIPLYQRLSDRVDRFELKRGNDEYKKVMSSVKSLMWYKLSDLKEKHRLILDIKEYIPVAVSQIERRKNSFSTQVNVSDVDLVYAFNELKFGIDGNYFLATYFRVIEGFKLMYFPFAAKQLSWNSFDISAYIMHYQNLQSIHSFTTYNLDRLKNLTDTVNAISLEKAIYVNTLKKNSHDPFFVWKNSDVRDQIRDLFAGNKITLLADVKQVKNQYNAAKFKTIELSFRSSNQNQTITNGLKNVLKSFVVHQNYTGLATIRCNDNFYKMTSDSIRVTFSFRHMKSREPLSRSVSYDKLRNRRPMLSPYALWEFQLFPLNPQPIRFQSLEQYVDFVDMELRGIGEYLREDESACEDKDLPIFYSKVEN